MIPPIPTKAPLSEQIEYIMAHFDFARVVDVMKTLNWTWYYTDPATPTIDQCRELARQMLVSTTLENSYNHSGGFQAVIDQWGQLQLNFVIEDFGASEYCADYDRNMSY